MFDWLQQHVWPITAVSVGVFVVGMVALGWFVVHMPADWFRRPQAQAASLDGRHPLVRHTLRWLRNLLGIVLILIGIVLSLPLVPGPGVVTLLVGISLTDFPGKRKLEEWLVGKRAVLSPLNWFRAKWGRPPLEAPAVHAKVES